MPFDGVVLKSIVLELSDLLTGGRVEKIFQPEADELIINIRNKNRNVKLLISANASYPRVHITDAVKENPAVPPVFCMLLRKHLTGGKILNIDFHDYERIATIHIESTNELGDLTVKKLIIEIMGRYSNIILTNSEDKIIDSIKHIDGDVSSVREVMPARPYILPPQQDKTIPDQLNPVDFTARLDADGNIALEKYLLNRIKGFSPLLCKEICYRALLDGKSPVLSLSGSDKENLQKALEEVIGEITANAYKPCIIYQDKEHSIPLDFHCLDMKQARFLDALPTINAAVDKFYTERDSSERLRQKKSDLLRVLNNNIERCNKKLSIQQDTLRDVADREKLKLYGELITANIHCLKAGLKTARVQNYYSAGMEYVEIPMDENMTPQENAQKYYRRYSKAKATFSYTTKQHEETMKELQYLESVLHLLDICASSDEINEIRQELVEQGYIHSVKKQGGKKQEKVSSPILYRASDGNEILVGKNNRQNDLLTMKTASSNDIWLHTRNIPGSHVIIKKLQNPVSDQTLLEAASIAAYHSKAKSSSGVPVDYTAVKNVKKPPGAKPGMVVYNDFKTVIVTPDEATVLKLRCEKQV